MIVFWTLIILSVSHFALAAPVAVGEIREVRSNAVDALKDGMAAWEKRMDSDDKNRWSTNEAYRKDDNPGSSSDSDDATGSYSDEDMYLLGSDSEQDSEQTESDARGPDRYYNNRYPLDDSDGLYFESDSANSDSDSASANPNGDDNGNSGYDGDNDNSGYDGDNDNDSDGDDTVQSEQAAAENANLGPESEHPATPEHTTDAEKLLKGVLRFRPRNSGSGAVGTPKRELQGTNR
jgi:hypothetical protein